jgi:hypothetical protein
VFVAGVPGDAVELGDDGELGEAGGLGAGLGEAELGAGGVGDAVTEAAAGELGGALAEDGLAGETLVCGEPAGAALGAAEHPARIAISSTAPSGADPLRQVTPGECALGTEQPPFRAPVSLAPLLDQRGAVGGDLVHVGERTHPADQLLDLAGDGHRPAHGHDGVERL